MKNYKFHLLKPQIEKATKALNVAEIIYYREDLEINILNKDFQRVKDLFYVFDLSYLAEESDKSDDYIKRAIDNEV